VYAYPQCSPGNSQILRPRIRSADGNVIPYSTCIGCRFSPCAIQRLDIPQLLDRLEELELQTLCDGKVFDVLLE
jgi:hypothetical protein